MEGNLQGKKKDPKNEEACSPTNNNVRKESTKNPQSISLFRSSLRHCLNVYKKDRGHIPSLPLF